MKSEIENMFTAVEDFSARLSSAKLDRRGQLARQHAGEFADKLAKLVEEYQTEEHEAEITAKLSALTGNTYTMAQVLDAAGVVGDRDDQRRVTRVMQSCGFVPALVRVHGDSVSGFHRVAK
jgi:hypothetical protein